MNCKLMGSCKFEVVKVSLLRFWDKKTWITVIKIGSKYWQKNGKCCKVSEHFLGQDHILKLNYKGNQFGMGKLYLD